MNRIKRIAAMIGASLLILLYIITFISAIFTTPATSGLFMACIFSTVAIPIIIYAISLIYRLLKNRKEEREKK